MDKPNGGCPLCYAPVALFKDSNGCVFVCRFNCLSSLIAPKPTEAEAQEEFTKFLKELELGAEMWGSKIQNGLGDD